MFKWLLAVIIGTICLLLALQVSKVAESQLGVVEYFMIKGKISLLKDRLKELYLKYDHDHDLSNGAQLDPYGASVILMWAATELYMLCDELNWQFEGYSFAPFDDVFSKYGINLTHPVNCTCPLMVNDTCILEGEELEEFRRFCNQSRLCEGNVYAYGDRYEEGQEAYETCMNTWRFNKTKVLDVWTLATYGVKFNKELRAWFLGLDLCGRPYTEEHAASCNPDALAFPPSYRMTWFTSGDLYCEAALYYFDESIGSYLIASCSQLLGGNDNLLDDQVTIDIGVREMNICYGSACVSYYYMQVGDSASLVSVSAYKGERPFVSISLY